MSLHTSNPLDLFFQGLVILILCLLFLVFSSLCRGDLTYFFSVVFQRCSDSFVLGSINIATFFVFFFSQVVEPTLNDLFFLFLHFSGWDGEAGFGLVPLLLARVGF